MSAPTRRVSDLSALLRRGQRASDFRPVYQAIWALLADGTPDEVQAVLHAWADPPAGDPRAGWYATLADYLARSPRPELAHVLLRDAAQRPWVRARVAEELALGQPRAVTRAWLEQGIDDPQLLPILAPIAHTLVIQGWWGDATALGARVQAALDAADHPLAILPLRLTPFEAGLPLPTYTHTPGELGGEGRPALTGQAIAADQADPVRPQVWPALTRDDTRIDVAALSAPFQGWLDDSGGELEAHAFSAAAPLRTLDASLLGTLPVASIASPATVRLQAVTAEAVFHDLYVAGLSGGAHGGAEYAATARLLARGALRSPTAGGRAGGHGRRTAGAVLGVQR